MSSDEIYRITAAAGLFSVNTAGAAGKSHF